MRFVVDISFSEEGLATGSVRCEGQERPVRFSGLLDLLQLLEARTARGGGDGPASGMVGGAGGE